MKRRHVCRIVTAIHSLIAEAGLVAIWSGEEPKVSSVTICQVNRESATRSSPASQIWHLSAGERDRKVGSPNSAYNGEMRVLIPSYASLKKENSQVAPVYSMDGVAELG